VLPAALSERLGDAITPRAHSRGVLAYLEDTRPAQCSRLTSFARTYQPKPVGARGSMHGKGRCLDELSSTAPGGP
jgi:hypothetical protein